MKKLLIGILVFSFNVSTFANDNGFRKFKWEDSILRYESIMQLTSENGKDKKFYIIEDDDMSFGDISLTSVIYIFYKGKFSSVMLQTDQSASNSKQVLIKLKKKFGKPLYENKYINKYSWEGKATAVNLKCYSSSHKCSITYNSVAVSNRKKSKEVAR